MPHIASICRILFALVLSLLLHACSRGDKPAEPVTVSAPTVRATLYDARECRSLPGEVRSRNSVTLASKISGTVVEVLAVEGAVVEKGQVILRIDDSEIKQRVQAVQSSAQQAGLERQALAARRDMAKTNLERMQKLFAQQVISRDELDRAATEYQALRKQEQALAASAASAGHQGAEAQSLMGYSVVTAPFRGVLSRRFVDQGAFVNAGAPLAAIDDVQSGYELEAQADESLMAQVSQGMQVLGTLLPPPTGTQGTTDNTQGAAAPSLNGQSQIALLEVTPQQAELIRFTQLDGNLSLVLRAPGDAEAPVVKTTGITVRELVDQYGVLPPKIILTEQP